MWQVAVTRSRGLQLTAPGASVPGAPSVGVPGDSGAVEIPSLLSPLFTASEACFGRENAQTVCAPDISGIVRRSSRAETNNRAGRQRKAVSGRQVQVRGGLAGLRGRAFGCEPITPIARMTLLEVLFPGTARTKPTRLRSSLD